MNSGLKRKEIWLPKSVMDYYEAKAKSKEWSLKKYLEQELIKKYNSGRTKKSTRSKPLFDDTTAEAMNG